MNRVFIDSNIPMYYAGRESEFKEPCRYVLESIAKEELDGFTSVEVLQEILYRFWHLSDIATGHKIFDLFSKTVSAVLPVIDKDVHLARELSDNYKCSPRDLLHLAVMQNNDIDIIVSADKDFDYVHSIRRIDPLEFKEWLEAE